MKMQEKLQAGTQQNLPESGLVCPVLSWYSLAWPGLIWSDLVWSGLDLIWSGVPGLVWPGLEWSGPVSFSLAWSSLAAGAEG